MTDEKEIISAMALTRISRFNLAQILDLYHRLGSATAVVDNRKDIRAVVPDASQRLVESLATMDPALTRAEQELTFDRQHHIEPLVIGEERYPQRLASCPDAPLVVYYRGNADLNARRTLSIVGTRRATAYGKDIINSFISDLQTLCPDVLVVSGLAYGVDITAHRASLREGFDTVGVLAHGLDDLYPSAHRQTAIEMLSQGGLLTEYMTHTRPYAHNFVQRNRIVAGMADATILVESARKGGGLITCSIAQSYGRDVFAFPGPVGAQYSEGCNNIIRDNGAALITSAVDFVKAMGWSEEVKLEKAHREGIERDMFPNLSSDEKKIADALLADNDQLASMLSVKTGIAINQLTARLFEMEMKGVIRTLAGGIYHLIK